MQFSQPGRHFSVDDLIIKQGGFPTHAADNADGFHIAPNHVRLSLFRIETGKGLLFLRADGNILENYSN
jgi:hypothetical protein